MKNKIILVCAILAFVLLAGSVFAGVSYCCEKTNSGAWCQNSEAENCDSAFRKVPASCEATSYCKLGCCYDSQEGTCMENTPQKICQDSNGTWADDSECNIPQCELGCCLIGDQSAFVTPTRCKKLASLYGLEINFRTDITNEVQCIASASPDVKGACAFEEDFANTCKLTTKKECSEIGKQNVSFHEGYLCSSEELGTDCSPTEKTTCVEGKDEVYFVDSCGNLANIYDASKLNDKEYWAKIKSKAESCSPESGNAESSSCGNCDYYLGSTCREYKRSEDKVKPSYGDNICKDLACEYNGEEYQHGETWCADSEGVDRNLPGSRYFRMICYDNEVTVEPCADYRQEICLQAEVNGFRTAGCRVNRWQDCSTQIRKQDCENTDRRDCVWTDSKSEEVKEGETLKLKCVPKYSPGFDFWNTEGDAKSLCSAASVQCTVTCEKGFSGGEECDSDLGCVDSSGDILDSWQKQMNQTCSLIGDCGNKINYIGKQGYNNESAIKIGDDAKNKE